MGLQVRRAAIGHMQGSTPENADAAEQHTAGRCAQLLSQTLGGLEPTERQLLDCKHAGSGGSPTGTCG